VRVPWWLRGLTPSPEPLPVATPAAETRSAEDYEEAAWNEAFQDEIGPIMVAKNAKWSAYGRGEHVSGAKPLLGMGSLTPEEREALHGGRRSVTVAEQGEPRITAEAMSAGDREHARAGCRGAPPTPLPGPMAASPSPEPEPEPGASA
jgi:hypothetical protein